MKRITLIFVIVALILSAYQCNKSTSRKLIVVLIDLSESANKPEMKKLYLDSFKKIVDKITHEDALFVAPITEKSILELNFIVEEENIVPLNITINTNLQVERKLRKEGKEKLEAKKQEFLKKVEDVLINQTRKIYKTDILSSLNMADERVFRSFSSQNYKKMLVIMSDMMEDSDVYNFEKQLLSDGKVSEIISSRKEKGLLPKLNDVKIFVVGANAPSVSKYNDIKKFWIKYFVESGAELTEEHYSSSCPVKICE